MLKNKQRQGFEYHSNWQSKAKATLRCQSRCTNNPFHGKATVVHHLHYRRSLLRRILGILLWHNPFKVSIAGKEIPGWDIVPVCDKCHENHYGRSSSRVSLHSTKLWVQRGGLGNHQVWAKAWELRIKFSILWLFSVV